MKAGSLKGTRVVSVTVEIDLLERADAYTRKSRHEAGGIVLPAA